jgi:subtilisin family serine protease
MAAVAAALLGPAAPAQAGGSSDHADDDTVHVEVREALETEATVEALVVLAAASDLEEAGQVEAVDERRAAVLHSLQRIAARAQPQVERLVEEHGDRVLNRFWVHNTVLVRARAKTVSALAELPEVEEIIPNFEVYAPEPTTRTAAAADAVDGYTWGLDRMVVDRVHAEFGIDGANVRVAVLDTGIDADHPDLAGKLATDDDADPSFPGGWIAFDSTGHPVVSKPHDTMGHGTHIAGTIHGGDASGTQIGVAPGAEMMHALVMPHGIGTFAQVIAGMQWAIAPHDDQGRPAGQPAHVVSAAFGAFGFADALVEPTRGLRAAGVLPVMPIGNDCGPVETVSPGNIYEAVGVGATDVDDAVPAFSCGGVVQRDDWSDPPPDWPATWVKPDLSAPGVDVWSARPDGTHAFSEGTSSATAHVAGAAALLRSAAPDLDVDAVLEVLFDTAAWDSRYATHPPDTRLGHGRVDAYEAVRRVALHGHTDEVGRYRLLLGLGEHDLQVPDRSHLGRRLERATGVPLLGWCAKRPGTRAASEGRELLVQALAMPNTPRTSRRLASLTSCSSMLAGDRVWRGRAARPSAISSSLQPSDRNHAWTSAVNAGSASRSTRPWKATRNHASGRRGSAESATARAGTRRASRRMWSAL